MKYFLDTNICIYILNHRPASIAAKFAQYDPDLFGISSIVLSELNYGIEKSQKLERNRARLEAFLKPFQLIDYGTEAAKHYGEIRADLEVKGQVIGREDLMIAAHACSLGVTLITNNIREFERVSDLDIEAWI